MEQKYQRIWPGLICLTGIMQFLVFGKAWSQSATTDQNSEFDMDKAWKEIEKRVDDYENALKDGDLEALGNLYTVDAEILSHNQPIKKGRDNILKVFEKMIQDSVTDCGFTTTGLWGNEELLVEQGTGYFAHAAGKWISRGNYLLVWKKVDGQWKIFRDTWFKKSGD